VTIQLHHNKVTTVRQQQKTVRLSQKNMQQRSNSRAKINNSRTTIASNKIKKVKYVTFCWILLIHGIERRQQPDILGLSTSGWTYRKRKQMKRDFTAADELLKQAVQEGSVTIERWLTQNWEQVREAMIYGLTKKGLAQSLGVSRQSLYRAYNKAAKRMATAPAPAPAASSATPAPRPVQKPSAPAPASAPKSFRKI